MKWNNFLHLNEVLYPEKTAIVDQRSNLSYNYSELSHIANSWALYLQNLGIEKGDRVAILAQNRFEHISLLFAVSKLGAILVPLNFRLSIGEVDSILERIEAKVLLAEGEQQQNYSGKYINLNEFDYATLRELATTHVDLSAYFEETSSTLDDDILMQFTSGSTGIPKGVLMHGRMLLSNQEGTVKNWQLTNDDVTMVETPFFHTGGYNVLCLPLLFLGGKVVLAEKFDVENVFRTILKERITVYFGVPTMFQMIADTDSFDYMDFSSLRFFVSGGSACPVELIEQYQQKDLSFKQGFGLTEVGPNCFLLESIDAITKLGSIGKPMSHSNVLVKGLSGDIAKVNEVGELLIKGDHLCRGYYADENRFNESLDNGYFKTGDLVRFDEDGFFYVTGRIKDMYISGGENVYPGEVEKQLVTIKGVQEAVVVAIPSMKWGEVGHAFLQTKQRLISSDDIRDLLKDSLSRYKFPHSVECLDTFPLLANGKVNRNKLKEMATLIGR
ncbi:hypothetical protein A9Q84_00845 [Halobacteriovorax marinus]|uniref:Uncharacterized protein n=1 Tax=Halobacteriovorax marinus TaxID=97084 RepID=A0A1Y5FBZ8_9BACT|nr:hypothetical protein A9Q84_00845 [Halobacteriovorax marinus]